MTFQKGQTHYLVFKCSKKEKGNYRPVSSTLMSRMVAEEIIKKLGK